MYNNMEEKVYFVPGDVVTLRQDIPNRPIMVVSKIDKNLYKLKDNSISTLKGISCFWFTSEGAFQENLFSTKDLVLVKSGRED